MSGPRNIKRLIEVGTRVLEDSTHIFEDHVNEDEARGLLASVLRIDDDELDDLDPDFKPAPRQTEKYLSLIARRAAGEPFPFLVGRIEFYGLELKVKPGAFVPRPSSELVVEWALTRLRRMKNPTVVDVCAGAGPIAMAIAAEVPAAKVWALDILNEGLDHGRTNAKRLGIQNVTFRRSDMYQALPKQMLGAVDLITGHIPYVPIEELDDLPAEVREHEPLVTLTDHSDDGLILMARAIEEGIPFMKPGAWMLLEMSDDITRRVRRMCVKAGLEDHGEVTDDDDLSVVVEARKPV